MVVDSIAGVEAPPLTVLDASRTRKAHPHGIFHPHTVAATEQPLSPLFDNRFILRTCIRCCRRHSLDSFICRHRRRSSHCRRSTSSSTMAEQLVRSLGAARLEDCHHGAVAVEHGAAVGPQAEAVAAPEGGWSVISE